MEIKEGYLYHIKDSFFKVVNDKELMGNHEKGRPTYFVVKKGELYWFIPLSSKVEKYKRIMEDKIKKYGKCYTIIIDKVFEEESAILIQNAFPILPKYVKHYHTRNGKEYHVPVKLQEKIKDTFEKVLSMLENNGINLFFTNIYKIKSIMLEELVKDKLEGISLLDVDITKDKDNNIVIETLDSTILLSLSNREDYLILSKLDVNY